MYKTAHAHNKDKTRAIIPSMRWDGKEDFSTWQNRSRSELTKILCLPFTKCDPEFKIEYKEDRGTFIETRFSFQSEEDFFVPCHFWSPKNASGALPLIICLQGHTKGMHISMGRPKYPGDEEDIKGGDRDFAIQAVKQGYCALMMEQRCCGELGGTENGPDCHFSSMAALLIGRTTFGERVWDVQRALDITLQMFPEADKNTIVCMGHSGGGTTTLFASCLDTRIGYSMPSGYFCSFDYCIGDNVDNMYRHHCDCNNIPNIRLFFDMGDMTGMIAPRPLVIVLGKDDPLYPQQGVQKAFREAQRMYTGAHAADKLKLVIGDGGHRFYADIGWKAMNDFLR